MQTWLSEYVKACKQLGGVVPSDELAVVESIVLSRGKKAAALTTAIVAITKPDGENDSKVDFARRCRDSICRQQLGKKISFIVWGKLLEACGPEKAK